MISRSSLIERVQQVEKNREKMRKIEQNTANTFNEIIKMKILDALARTRVKVLE